MQLSKLLIYRKNKVLTALIVTMAQVSYESNNRYSTVSSIVLKLRVYILSCNVKFVLWLLSTTIIYRCNQF